MLDQIIDIGLIIFILFVMICFISWIFNEMKEWFGSKISSNEEDEEVDTISSEIIYQIVNDRSAQKRTANYLEKNITTIGTKELVEELLSMTDVKQKINVYFSKNKHKINKDITEKDIEDNIRYVFEIRFGDKDYIKSFSIE